MTVSEIYLIIGLAFSIITTVFLKLYDEKLFEDLAGICILMIPFWGIMIPMIIAGLIVSVIPCLLVERKGKYNERN